MTTETIIRLNARIANQREQLAHKEFVIASLHEQVAALEARANEADHLRRVLQVVRPYVSDKAGAGIIDAINAALKEGPME